MIIMTNFSDIFKSSFLENMTSVSLVDMVITLLLAFGVGLFIFLVYKKTYAGVMYSSSFGGTLIAMTMITSMTILAVTSNVVLSLGMVGALSIVRFRTAVKEPMDVMFLFWAISVGIICGAGLAEVAVILSVVITVGILVRDQMPVAKAPMILVVNAEDLDLEERITQTAKQYVKHMQVKSRNMTDTALDLVIELRTGEGTALERDIRKIPGVTAVSLLAHDGEVPF